MGPDNYLAVFGHTNVDHISLVPSFPPMNQSVQIDRFEHLWGGTTANIAAVAARQGVPVALASFVGHGFPPQFQEHLRSVGLDLTDLTVVEGQPTPECFIFSDGQDNQMAFVIQGPMEMAGGLDIQAHSIDTAATIHLATGNPQYHMRVAQEGRRRGRRVCFDPGQELHYKWTAETFSQMMRLADMLFLNDTELSRALSYTGLKGPEELLDLVDAVLLTKGRQGSALMNADGTIEVPMIPARKVEDTTGAGDAYRGGYYSGLYRGLTQRDAMLLGAATASLVVERQGPQTNIPTFEQAWERVVEAGSGGA